MNEKEMINQINAHAAAANMARAAAAKRTAHRRRRTALMIEAGLFLLALALMALEAAGLVSCVVAWPVIALTVCVMCVFGGYVIGAVGR